MPQIPAIKKLMTPFPYSVDIDAQCKDAEALMDEHDFRHLPVTKEGELVGIITSRDIAQYARVLGAIGQKHLATVKSIYRPDAYIVDIDEPLDNVLTEMAGRHIGSAIVTRKNKLAGVFTTTDLCRYVAADLRTRFRPGGDDAA